MVHNAKTRKAAGTKKGSFHLIGRPCEEYTLEGLQGFAKGRNVTMSGSKAQLCRRLTGRPCRCGTYRREASSGASKKKVVKSSKGASKTTKAEAKKHGIKLTYVSSTGVRKSRSEAVLKRMIANKKKGGAKSSSKKRVAKSSAKSSKKVRKTASCATKERAKKHGIKLTYVSSTGVRKSRSEATLKRMIANKK